jgi:uncharacterized membrane protein
LAAKLWSSVKSAVAWLWEASADPRNKNRLIFILALLTAFGMIAPATATRLRDAILAFAL